MKKMGNIFGFAFETKGEKNWKSIIGLGLVTKKENAL